MWIERMGLSPDKLKENEEQENADLDNLSSLIWYDETGERVEGGIAKVVADSGVDTAFDMFESNQDDVLQFKKKISVRKDLTTPNGQDGSTFGMKIKIDDRLYTVSDDVHVNQESSKGVNRIAGILATPGEQSEEVMYHGYPVKVIKIANKIDGTSFTSDNKHMGYSAMLQFPPEQGGGFMSYTDFLTGFVKSGQRVFDPGMGVKNVSKGGQKLEDIVQASKVPQIN